MLDDAVVVEMMLRFKNAGAAMGGFGFHLTRRAIVSPEGRILSIEDGRPFVQSH